jgi:hypothetical protein
MSEFTMQKDMTQLRSIWRSELNNNALSNKLTILITKLLLLLNLKKTSLSGYPSL